MVLNLIRNLDVLPKVVWKRNGFFKVCNFIWNPPLHLSGVFYHHDTKPKYSTEYRVMVQCLDNSFWHIWSYIVAFGFYMVIDSLLKNSPNLFHSSKRCIIRISVTRVNLWMWKQLQRTVSVCIFPIMGDIHIIHSIELVKQSVLPCDYRNPHQSPPRWVSPSVTLNDPLM